VSRRKIQAAYRSAGQGYRPQAHAHRSGLNEGKAYDSLQAGRHRKVHESVGKQVVEPFEFVSVLRPVAAAFRSDDLGWLAGLMQTNEWHCLAWQEPFSLGSMDQNEISGVRVGKARLAWPPIETGDVRTS